MRGLSISVVKCFIVAHKHKIENVICNTTRRQQQANNMRTKNVKQNVDTGNNIQQFLSVM